jgi:hypothetical protein
MRVSQSEKQGRAGGREFPLRGMQGGHGKDARDVTAIRQVAGANLAYRFLPR